MRRTSKARLRADRLARWIVTAGGLAIIASIVGILGFLLYETLPLLANAEHSAWTAIELGPRTNASPDLVAAASDESKRHFVTLDASGMLRAHSRGGAQTFERRLVEAPARIASVQILDADTFACATRDGRLFVQHWTWADQGDAARPVRFDDAQQLRFPSAEPSEQLLWSAARDRESGSIRVVFVAERGDGDAEMTIASIDFSQSLLGEAEVERSRVTRSAPAGLTTLALASDLEALYATSEDAVLWWPRLASDEEPKRTPLRGARVRSSALLLGDSSLLVGREDGSLTQFFATRAAGEELAMTRIRDFEAMPSAVLEIGRSRRNKAFIARDASASLGYYFATTARRSFLTRTPAENPRAMQLCPKNDGILVAGASGLFHCDVEDAHPEATMHAYFEPVWYEGYEGASYEWESTGGTNEFEPKLSLVPLLFGTLKATVFAMLLSFPLAVLAAIFVSQFTHPRIRAVLKPVIEIMAALPSVILGFVAALWLAPLLEAGFTAVLLFLVIAPFAVLLAGQVWAWMERRRGRRFAMGMELPIVMVAIVSSVVLCAWLDAPVESLLFGGNFSAFVYDALGLRYEQRNSVVIAIAMAFAVVPIIFTISEDAFSNVPRSLVSGSLALGATRWQTVTRVVLPTASPGVLSATMVGFGRAIGETMIVLMATGNTAIMEWNPFNGFRTLAANIATEASEAPVGGTLYRTLFLTAVLLFVLTFVINTLAEVVRIGLRRKYSSL